MTPALLEFEAAVDRAKRDVPAPVAMIFDTYRLAVRDLFARPTEPRDYLASAALRVETLSASWSEDAPGCEPSNGVL